MGEIDAQKPGVHAQNGLDPLHARKEMGAGLDGFHDLELAACPHLRGGRAQQTGRFLKEQADRAGIEMKQVLERIVDDINQAQDQGDLYQERQQALQGAVALLPVQGPLFLDDQGAVAPVPLLDVFERRLDFDHDQGVLLRTQGQGEHEKLGQEGEEDDGGAVAADQQLAKVHEVAKGYTEQCIDYVHSTSLVPRDERGKSACQSS